MMPVERFKQMPKHDHRQQARAFTLVELLVVIGIIAVLLSILLPSLNKAREQGNRVACSSNLRQWHAMVMMYHGDWKSLPGPLAPATMSHKVAWNLPYGGWRNSRRDRTTANPEILYNRYFKSSEGAWVCPSNRVLFEEGSCAQAATYAGDIFGFAYRINNQESTNSRFFFGDWSSPPTSPSAQNIFDRRPKKLSEVRSAGGGLLPPNPPDELGRATRSHSDIWMMSDIDGINWDTAMSTWWGIESDTIPVARRRFKSPHKTGGSFGRNYLFFDGSVRFHAYNGRGGKNEPYNGYNNRNIP